MPLDRNRILNLLKESFPDAKVTLEDLKGNGDYYALTITCASFNGKSRVHQHQMVYNSLKGYVGDAIHALTLKTIGK